MSSFDAHRSSRKIAPPPPRRVQRPASRSASFPATGAAMPEQSRPTLRPEQNLASAGPNSEVGLSWEFISRTRDLSLGLSLRALIEQLEILQRLHQRSGLESTSHGSVWHANLLFRQDGRALLPPDMEGLRAQPMVYVAPELRAGEGNSPAADLYAIGVMSLEFLIGETLTVKGLSTLVAGDAPVAQVWLPWLNDPLLAVALRSVRSNPGERWSSADALASAITQAARTRLGSRSELAQCVGLALTHSDNRATPIAGLKHDSRVPVQTLLVPNSSPQTFVRPTLPCADTSAAAISAAPGSCQSLVLNLPAVTSAAEQATPTGWRNLAWLGAAALGTLAALFALWAPSGIEAEQQPYKAANQVEPQPRTGVAAIERSPVPAPDVPATLPAKAASAAAASAVPDESELAPTGQAPTRTVKVQTPKKTRLSPRKASRKSSRVSKRHSSTAPKPQPAHFEPEGI